MIHDDKIISDISLILDREFLRVYSHIALMTYSRILKFIRSNDSSWL